MNYSFKDITFTQEEFTELKSAIGEFRRVCRDQVFRYVKGDYLKSENKTNIERLEIVESIICKFNTAEYLNHSVK